MRNPPTLGLCFIFNCWFYFVSVSVVYYYSSVNTLHAFDLVKLEFPCEMSNAQPIQYSNCVAVNTFERIPFFCTDTNISGFPFFHPFCCHLSASRLL